MQFSPILLVLAAVVAALAAPVRPCFYRSCIRLGSWALRLLGPR